MSTRMNEFVICRATEKDLERLVELRLEVIREVFRLPDDADLSNLEATNREYYVGELPTEGHIACFAMAEDDIAACGGVCLYREMPSPDNPSGKCGYLMNIYVRPRFRHKGVGKDIVKWLINEARSRGVTKIFLETTDPGRQLYADLGFKEMEGYLILKDNC